jgi:mRNA interferase RelE/StbE
MYQVILAKRVRKSIDNIPNPYYTQIEKHIDELRYNPRPNGYRKLEGHEDLFRIRVGVYRIIYSIEDNILRIEVLKVAHRKDIYKDI